MEKEIRNNRPTKQGLVVSAGKMNKTVVVAVVVVFVVSVWHDEKEWYMSEHMLSLFSIMCNGCS